MAFRLTALFLLILSGCNLFSVRVLPLEIAPRQKLEFALSDNFKEHLYQKPLFSFGPEGKLLGGLWHGSKSSQVVIWETTEGRVLNSFRYAGREGIMALKLLNENQLLLLTYNGKALRYSIPNGRPITARGARNSIYKQRFIKFGAILPGKNQIVVAGKHSVMVADVDSGRILEQFRFKEITCEIGAPYLSSDEDYIFFSGYGLGDDNGGYLGIIDRNDASLAYFSKIYPAFVEGFQPLPKSNSLVVFRKNDHHSPAGEIALRSIESIRLFDRSGNAAPHALKIPPGFVTETGIKNINNSILAPDGSAVLLVGTNNVFVPFFAASNFNSAGTPGFSHSVNLRTIQGDRAWRQLMDYRIDTETQTVHINLYDAETFFHQITSDH